MHRTMLLLVASFSLLFNPVLGAQLVLRIQPSQILANPNSLPPSTHASITAPNGVVFRSSLRKDNSIVFDDMSTAGSHLLNIYTRDYTFASYRIDTKPDLAAAGAGSNDAVPILIEFVAQLFPGTQWSDTGANLVPSQPDSRSSTGQSPRPQSTFTIVPKVLAAKQFYEQRPAFSPLTLLKNPMILLAIVALGFTFGMPKLMESMDPEMRAEYEEMQKKGPTAALGRAMNGQGPSSSSESFDLAGYLAGQKKDASDMRGKR
ncbi:hypothetical protein LTR64_004982 [Lithohypha guttulata]|uniref:uncharacterized protein n=1 Tax=Lithohypha guttulata TaxID=1690604 RepID=UPI002DE1E19C|nr:hypothetical protein LTR51_005182 [Lithohypha guttulata]